MDVEQVRIHGSGGPVLVGRISSRRQALLAGGGMMLALSACGPAASSGGESGAKQQQPATLRVGERAGTEEQAFNARLPVFAQKYPHINVEREVITGDMIAALKAMAASNTLPDNCHAYTGGQQYHAFALGGAFRNIESMIARDKVDLKGWFPEMIEIMRIDGKLFGLPFKGQVLGAGFYYNANLFRARGLPEPDENWTLDELIKAAQQLTIRQGTDTVQWGYALQTWGGENFTGHLRQWNGDSFSKDGKRAAMDTPQVLEALQWYETMFLRERILHPLADAAASFEQGKVAMIGRTYFNYKSTLLPRVGDRFQWDGTMMPKNSKTGKRGGIFAGDSHAISRDSKSPDAAFELLKWITDKEFGVALGLQTSGSTTLGGRPDVYADERILNAPQYSKQMQKAQLDSVSQIREPSVTPYNFRAEEVYAIRDAATTRITTGEAKADPGYLRELNREMQVVLDLPRP
ncbi:MAG TPA: sugar ABC transporter substrate-binding protein [Chloroflexota bacterium]|nr:sugar ABC transporter substrate-binding protein [Chloroflexota bacterium]